MTPIFADTPDCIPLVGKRISLLCDCMAASRRLSRFQFRLRTLLLAITFLSLYLGGYLALRQPVIVVEESMGGLITAGRREPDYRFARPICRILFGPVAWLDRQLRPDYWGPYTEWDEY